MRTVTSRYYPDKTPNNKPTRLDLVLFCKCLKKKKYHILIRTCRWDAPHCLAKHVCGMWTLSIMWRGADGLTSCALWVIPATLLCPHLTIGARPMTSLKSRGQRNAAGPGKYPVDHVCVCTSRPGAVAGSIARGPRVRIVCCSTS